VNVATRSTAWLQRETASVAGRSAAWVRRETGQATIEFSGMILYLFLGALLAWQMALVGWTAVSASNAVRTAERLMSRGASMTRAQQAGTDSLSGRFLESNSRIWFVTDAATSAPEAKASVMVPLILPGLPSGLPIDAHAELPQTG
jgi:hypothetical protein